MTTPAGDPVCATCRHWWAEEGDEWGECTRPEHYEQPNRMYLFVSRPIGHECVAALMTVADFGCRAWEPRGGGERR